MRAAVAEVPDDASVIVVHDAARPLSSDEIVERVLKPLAEGFHGAVPALPVADTIKRVQGGEVVETVDRADLVAVQTPQAFLADYPAHGARRRRRRGDRLLVAGRGGRGRVAVVEGDHRLLKVTEPSDLELVERLLQPS